MKDKRVPRIDHTGHDHPDTSHYRSKCRQEMIAAAAASEGKDELMLDKGEVKIKRGRRSTAKRSTEKKSVTAIVPEQGQTIPLDTMRQCVETLDYVEQTLTDYAHIEGVALLLDYDGTRVRATHDGASWNVGLA
jgi:hypothetical protein